MPRGQLWLNSSRLRELRLAAGLSQSELANRAGLVRQTIIRAERVGIAMPSSIKAMATVLEVDYLELLK